MPSTYTPIATTTLGSAAATVTFSSIPNTYTDLIVVAYHWGTTGVNGLYVTLNNNTSSLYSDTQLFGDGVNPGSARNTNITASYIGQAGSTAATTSIINIMNYANTTTNKTILSRNSPSGNIIQANAGLYRSTSAITSVLVSYYGNNFAAGSQFTLYGVKSA
jgi:hypothetical protein